ncbi:MAG TPA: AsmA-like C-terminal region-containing protein, partial [Methylibium sp.]|nr:AsmA-like C-terminal region-containing protein [Methylibium sp.]
SPYVPTSVALRTQQLRASGYTLHRLHAMLARGRGADAGLWRADLEATELAGRAEYRPPSAGEAAGRIVARLARLSLPKGGDEAVSELLDQAPASTVPALDVVVEDFELRGKKLGRLEVEAENRAAESGAVVAGDWELKRLKLVTPDATLAATGRWLAAPRPGVARRAVLDFKLDVGNGGALLSRLGEGEVLRGARGSITGQIDWLGSPLDIDYPSLGGKMRADFDRGQFLQAEPGIFKLLGVLSLQSLPRRLLFDFRDVFSEGFAFDALTGDLTLTQGVAHTSNLRLRGVQAVVLMEGSADVERETQDLRVVVVPEINAGAASLAYAAINPAVGLGSFLAQLFLRRPLAEAGTREFRVTGPWAAPQVERVERRSGARAVDDATPPS